MSSRFFEGGITANNLFKPNLFRGSQALGLSDPHRVIATDLGHSQREEFSYCFGMVIASNKTAAGTHMSTWLFKSEPDEYSIDDLAAEKPGYGVWNGIRNYQARNFLRDQVAVGDRVLIYHSSCTPAAIVGEAQVVRAAYADPSQFDPSSDYFDGKASKEKPRWFCVDVRFVKKYPRPLPLATIKQTAALQGMKLLQQPRLSVVPVEDAEYRAIAELTKGR